MIVEVQLRLLPVGKLLLIQVLRTAAVVAAHLVVAVRAAQIKAAVWAGLVWAVWAAWAVWTVWTVWTVAWAKAWAKAWVWVVLAWAAWA
ncbi:MAG: hypothetical protein CMJ76_15890, partial [Planctomycetaceae bacterium]|nr:hypothetical protein [Planctomycetaceae bacterium]